MRPHRSYPLIASLALAASALLMLSLPPQALACTGAARPVAEPATAPAGTTITDPNDPRFAEQMAELYRRWGAEPALSEPAMLRLLLLSLLLVPPALVSAPVAEPLPARLQDTGLDGPGVVAFAPRFPLWTDGAAKRRWIRLPAGAAIDTSAPDAWQFPPGTTLWKEFVFDGRPAETRMIRREADGRWTYTAYVWNDAGTEARLAPAQGRRLQLATGQRHDVPSRDDCLACHEAAPVPVLGYSAVQLGSAPVEPALGHLHGNCAHCHHPQGVPVRLNLQQRAADPGAARQAVLASLIEAPSRWQPAPGAALPAVPGPPLPAVMAGDPERSTLWLRMATRDPRRQMPPLGTHLPDPEGLALVAAWIRQPTLEPSR